MASTPTAYCLQTITHVKSLDTSTCTEYWVYYRIWPLSLNPLRLPAYRNTKSKPQKQKLGITIYRKMDIEVTDGPIDTIRFHVAYRYLSISKRRIDNFDISKHHYCSLRVMLGRPWPDALLPSANNTAAVGMRGIKKLPTTISHHRNTVITGVS